MIISALSIYISGCRNLQKSLPNPRSGSFWIICVRVFGIPTIEAMRRVVFLRGSQLTLRTPSCGTESKTNKRGRRNMKTQIQSSVGGDADNNICRVSVRLKMKPRPSGTTCSALLRPIIHHLSFIIQLTRTFVAGGFDGQTRACHGRSRRGRCRNARLSQPALLEHGCSGSQGQKVRWPDIRHHIPSLPYPISDPCGGRLSFSFETGAMPHEFLVGARRGM